MIRLARELRLVRRAFRNWVRVAFAGALWRYLPLPRRDLVLESRNGTSFVAPLDRKAGALYPALEVFAFSAYDCEWDLGDSPFVVDIGAHIGAFVLWLAERYRGLTAVCYEPDPETVAYLERNVRALDVALHRQAVSDRGGVLPLVRPLPAGGTSSLRIAAGDLRSSVVEVSVVSFDDVMGGIPRPVALLKLDCEGSEYDIVLKSDPQSWRDVHRVVIEYHPVPRLEPRSLVERLEGLGFELVQQTAAGGGVGTYWLSRRPLSASS
jgi:FkbM family methyltransferase